MTIPNGEFSFSLSERYDKNKDFYLFGGLPFLGVVVFVRPDGIDDTGVKRWKLVVKPYAGPSQNSSKQDHDSDVWR